MKVNIREGFTYQNNDETLFQKYILHICDLDGRLRGRASEILHWAPKTPKTDTVVRAVLLNGSYYNLIILVVIIFK